MTIPEPETRSELRWTAWPLVEHWWRSVLALASLFVAAVGVYYLVDNVPLTAVAVLVLAASLQGHFLPRSYVMDDEGVTVNVVGMKLRREWSYFRSYYADALGCMLSTFTYPSRLDSFRGVNLRFIRGNRGAVIAYVSSRLPRAQKKTRARDDGKEPV